MVRVIQPSKVAPTSTPSEVTRLIGLKDVNVGVPVGLLGETTTLHVLEKMNEKSGLSTKVEHTMGKEINTCRVTLEEGPRVISSQTQNVSSLRIQLG